MLVSLKQLLDHAAENNYALPAFNVNNMEQIKAILYAAKETDSPIIYQISKNAIKYAGPGYLESIVYKVIENNPNIPICLHLDHGSNVNICVESIKKGYSSVMIDGSLMSDMKTPSSLSYNIEISKKVTEIAHAKGVSVEGEIGCLGSIEENNNLENTVITSPKEAEIFVNSTKVDALAIAIGTSHGAYKFKRPPSKKTLSIETIKKINKRLPNMHLVIHGASEIPEKLIYEINSNGGFIPKTYGVPIIEIQRSIDYGVRKINIDTDLRLAYTACIRKSLKKNRSNFDFRVFGKEAIDSMKSVAVRKFKFFKSAGQNKKINAISLSNMAKKYI